MPWHQKFIDPSFEAEPLGGEWSYDHAAQEHSYTPYDGIYYILLTAQRDAFGPVLYQGYIAQIANGISDGQIFNIRFQRYVDSGWTHGFGDILVRMSSEEESFPDTTIDTFSTAGDYDAWIQEEITGIEALCNNPMVEVRLNYPPVDGIKYLLVDQFEVFGPSGPWAVDGELTSSGEVHKKDLKKPVGTLSSSGALQRKDLAKRAGVLTPSGLLVKKDYNKRSGIFMAAGALAKKDFTSRSGILATAGLLVKKDQKFLSGGVTFVGNISRKPGIPLSSALTFNGGLDTIFESGSVHVERSAALSFSGILHRKTFRVLEAEFGPVSLLVGQYAAIAQYVSGNLSFSSEGRRELNGRCMVSYPADSAEGDTEYTEELGGAVLETSGDGSGAFIVYDNVTCCEGFETQAFSYTPPERESELSFNGALGFKLGRTLRGQLDFNGDLIPLWLHGRRFEGVLSFAGAIDKEINLPRPGVLSFSGAMTPVHIPAPSIPAPYMWFHSGYLGTNGDTVYDDNESLLGERWFDHSGNSRHGTFFGTDVTFKRVTINGLTNRPVVRFGVEDGYLALNALHSFVDYTMVVVMIQIGANAVDQFAAVKSTDRNNYFVKIPTMSGGTNASNWRVKYGIFTTAEYVPQVTHTWTPTDWNMHMLRRSGLNHQMYRNSVFIGSKNITIDPEYLPGTLSFDSIRHGFQDDPAQSYTVEWIYWDRALSTEEREQVEDYVNTTYNMGF